MEQEILKSCLGIGGCRGIRGALSCRHHPEIADLILRIGRDRLVWKFGHHSLVRFNPHLWNSLFLARQADVELRASCVFPVWRTADNVGEDRHCLIQRVSKRDAQNLLLFASEIHFADAKLPLDCVIEVRVAGISFDQEPIRIRRG